MISRPATAVTTPLPVTLPTSPNPPAPVANQLASRILPKEVLDRSSHQFTPLG